MPDYCFGCYLIFYDCAPSKLFCWLPLLVYFAFLLIWLACVERGEFNNVGMLVFTAAVLAEVVFAPLNDMGVGLTIIPLQSMT